MVLKHIEIGRAVGLVSNNSIWCQYASLNFCSKAFPPDLDLKFHLGNMATDFNCIQYLFEFLGSKIFLLDKWTHCFWKWIYLGRITATKLKYWVGWHMLKRGGIKTFCKRDGLTNTHSKAIWLFKTIFQARLVSGKRIVIVDLQNEWDAY